MPTTFPILSSGSMKVYGPLASEAMAMYPAQLSFGYVTRVIRFLGDQEQRWLVRGELFSATLQYHGVNGYDLSIMRAFFRSMAGAASSVDLTHTFAIVIDGQGYAYCVIDQDALEVEVGRGETYSFELKIKQLRPN